MSQAFRARRIWTHKQGRRAFLTEAMGQNGCETELCGLQGSIIRSQGLKTNTVVTSLNLRLILQPHIIRAGPRKPIGFDGYKSSVSHSQRESVEGVCALSNIVGSFCQRCK